jgi:hypothetical protein
MPCHHRVRHPRRQTPSSSSQKSETDTLLSLATAVAVGTTCASRNVRWRAVSHLKFDPHPFCASLCNTRESLTLSICHSTLRANMASHSLRDTWASLPEYEKEIWKQKSRDLFRAFKIAHPDVSYHPSKSKSSMARKRRPSIPRSPARVQRGAIAL